MNVKDELQNCLYKIIRSNPFTGALLQEMTFKFNNMIPTAAITFNDKTSKFELLFNLTFFEKLEPNQRVAVLMHEILHFLHNHLFRFQAMNIKKEERMLWNISADMAINQYIQNLPEGTVDVAKFKTADGKPFPVFKTMEEYFKLIQEAREKEKMEGKDLADQKGKPEKDSRGNEIVDKDGKPYMNPDGTPQQGTGNEGPNKDILDRYKPFDDHDWDNLSEEDKERMVREMKNTINRTIEKTSYSHSSIPGHVKDFLQEIDTYLSKFNYKSILKEAIKRTAMAQDRESSWKRTNKRYGEYAPGTSLSRIPKLNMYIDTSGSISYRELNEFLDIVDGFLKQGTKTCNLVLWNTEIYYNKKYKIKSRLAQKEIQSGGTDVGPVVEKIVADKPELSIILTDGYFDKVDLSKYPGDVIWIISEGGNLEHPNKNIGKTLPMKGIKK